MTRICLKRKKKNLLEARGLLLVEALRERKQKSSVRDGKGHFITNTWTSQVPKGRSCREHDPRAYALSPSVCVYAFKNWGHRRDLILFTCTLPTSHTKPRLCKLILGCLIWGAKEASDTVFLLNIVFDCFISLLPSSPDIIGSPNLISPLNVRISHGWEWILGKSIWGNPEMSQYSSLPTAIIVPVDLSSWWSIYLMPSYLVRTPCTEFSDRGFPTLWAGLLPLSLVEARLHADHPAVSSRKSSPSFWAC